MPIALKIDRTEVMNKLAGAPAAVINGLEREMLKQMDQSRRWSIENRMADSPGPPGPLLHVRTGTLRNSMFARSQASTDIVKGFLGAGVSYAAVHEFGGTFGIPAHSRMQTMVFGQPITPKEVEVRAHQATYPQRAFIRPSLEARRDEIIAGLAGVVRDYFA